MPVLAAIDCGSNSFHLLIVRSIPGQPGWEILARERSMVRMAEGRIDLSLAPGAIDRGIEALVRFARVAREYEAERVVAVATSAIREAPNAETFLHRALEEAGIEVEVISGTEEARLIYLGVRSTLDLGERPSVIIDIGGGSTEIVLGTRDGIRFSRSLKIGAVRLTEQFLGMDPIDPEAYYRLVAHVKGTLHQLVPYMREVGYEGAIATSGTASALIELDAVRGGLEPPRNVTGSVLSMDRLTALETLVRQLPLRDRQKLEGLPQRRADIIVAGAAILRTILEELDLDGYTGCDRALREGLVVDALARAGWSSEPMEGPVRVRERAIDDMAERFGVERPHATQVRRLALDLFDQTRSLHGLDDGSREILAGASYLHDVGFHVNHSSHHKHSHYLIRHAEWVGFHDPEIQLMAVVARYHRRSLPKDKHGEFRELAPIQQARALKLIALMRVADALDHAGDQVVESVSLRLDDGETICFARLKPGASLDLWDVQMKADGWLRAFGHPLRVVAVQPSIGTGPLAAPGAGTVRPG